MNKSVWQIFGIVPYTRAAPLNLLGFLMFTKSAQPLAGDLSFAYPKTPWGVKTTCLEAPGVSLGGSGVSIGGVGSLRVVRISWFMSCSRVLLPFLPRCLRKFLFGRWNASPRDEAMVSLAAFWLLPPVIPIKPSSTWMSQEVSIWLVNGLYSL